jgi:hypothetical protein
VFSIAVQAPASRVGVPDDVATVVASLIDSQCMTGMVVPCGGGLRLT